MSPALPRLGDLLIWDEPEPYLQRYTAGTGALIRDCVIGDWLTGWLVNPTDPGTPTYDRLVDETWPLFEATILPGVAYSIIRKVPVA